MTGRKWKHWAYSQWIIAIRFARIFLPTDLSDYASYDRLCAVELASAFRASLHLIYVVDLRVDTEARLLDVL